jgi:hypothetical protein
MGRVKRMEVDDAASMRWLQSIRTPIYLAHLAQSEGVEDTWRLFGKNEEDGTYFDIFKSFKGIQIEENIEAHELC